jgi:hypothetical protein
VKSSLQALPVAMIVSRQLLITWKDSTSTGGVTVEESRPTLTTRATKMSSLLKSIQGYNHSGLNE